MAHSNGTQADEYGALRGIRVIDFGQYVAAPLVAMLLADNGAEVIRVDPPTGPRWDSPANAVLQRNKRSVVADLKTSKGRDFALDLIASADVVVDNFRPGVLGRLGISTHDAVTKNPRLIWCSIPGFASDSPQAGLPGWEGVVSAASGLYPPTMGATSGEPLFNPLPLASSFAAFIAAHAIVAALIGRERYGYGDIIEVPMFDAAFEALGLFGENPRPPTITNLKFDIVANLAFRGDIRYRASDGRYFDLDIPHRGRHAFWDRFLPPELKDATDEASRRRAEELLTELIRSKTSTEWERLTQEELGAASGTHQTSEEWLRDKHAHDSSSVVRVDDFEFGETFQAGFGVNLSRTSSSIRFPRRRVGQDDDQVRAELERVAVRPTEQVTRSLPHGRQPLAGVRVLDFTRLLAGPTAGRVLAEYGADVVKVDTPGLVTGRLDPRGDDLGSFAGRNTTMAGKRSLLLDLKSHGGQKVVSRLIESADIIHQSFVPGVASRLGLGPAILDGRPDLIYSTLQLHGNGGWRESYRGHEVLGEAVTGLTLRRPGDTPHHSPVLVNDHGGGHLTAFGILLAVLDRCRTGRGQHVETALSRASTLHQVPFMVTRADGSPVVTDSHQPFGWGPLDRFYRTNDGWIYLAAQNIHSLDQVEGVKHLSSLDSSEWGQELEKVFAADSSKMWTEKLTSGGVSAHRYVHTDELMELDDSKSRSMSVTIEHPGQGMIRKIGVAAKFESKAARLPAPARPPGWDTTEVLAEVGLTLQEIEQHLASGAVAVHS